MSYSKLQDWDDRRVVTFSMSFQLDCEFLASDAKRSGFKSFIGIKAIWTVLLLVLKNIVRKIAIKRPYFIMMCCLIVWPLMLPDLSLDGKKLHILYTLSGLAEACNTSATTSSLGFHPPLHLPKFSVSHSIKLCRYVWWEGRSSGALSLPPSSELSVQTTKRSPYNCAPELPFSPLITEAWVGTVCWRCRCRCMKLERRAQSSILPTSP